MNIEDMKNPWRALTRIQRRAEAIPVSTNKNQLADEIVSIAAEALDGVPEKDMIHSTENTRE